MIRRIVRSPRAGQWFSYRADRLTDERPNVMLPSRIRFAEAYRLFGGRQPERMH